MRVVSNIPHKEFKITVFSWNHKYLLKFEKENLEQTYKISEFDLMGEDDVQEILNNEEFMNKVSQRFNDMQDDLHQALHAGY